MSGGVGVREGETVGMETEGGSLRPPNMISGYGAWKFLMRWCDRSWGDERVLGCKGSWCVL